MKKIIVDLDTLQECIEEAFKRKYLFPFRQFVIYVRNDGICEVELIKEGRVNELTHALPIDIYLLDEIDFNDRFESIIEVEMQEFIACNPQYDARTLLGEYVNNFPEQGPVSYFFDYFSDHAAAGGDRMEIMDGKLYVYDYDTVIYPQGDNVVIEIQGVVLAGTVEQVETVIEMNFQAYTIKR